MIQYLSVKVSDPGKAPYTFIFSVSPNVLREEMTLKEFLDHVRQFLLKHPHALVDIESKKNSEGYSWITDLIPSQAELHLNQLCNEESLS